MYRCAREFQTYITKNILHSTNFVRSKQRLITKSIYWYFEGTHYVSIIPTMETLWRTCHVLREYWYDVFLNFIKPPMYLRQFIALWNTLYTVLRSLCRIFLWEFILSTTSNLPSWMEGHVIWSFEIKRHHLPAKNYMPNWRGATRYLLIRVGKVVCDQVSQYRAYSGGQISRPRRRRHPSTNSINVGHAISYSMLWLSVLESCQGIMLCGLLE